MVNQAGLDLIKKWEGCKLKAYRCPAGVWTVGYGLTSAAGFIQVGPDTVLTQEEADWYLEQAVNKYADGIRDIFTAPINDNQFAAFVSLAYNVGIRGVRNSSAVRHFNAGDLDKVPASIRAWNKAGGKVVKGLVNRRDDEVRLFETPDTASRPDQIPAEHPASKGRSSPAQSRTVQATMVQIASGAGGGIGAIASLEGNAQLVAIGGCALIVLMALWILRERLQKWAAGVK
jgi:lysozyme